MRTISHGAPWQTGMHRDFVLNTKFVHIKYVTKRRNNLLNDKFEWISIGIGYKSIDSTKKLYIFCGDERMSSDATTEVKMNMARYILTKSQQNYLGLPFVLLGMYKHNLERM